MLRPKSFAPLSFLPFFAGALWIACAKERTPATVLGGAVDSGSGGDGSTQADVGVPTDAGPRYALPAVPFHTDERWILDANGKRFKLASVNWYGAEEKDYVVAGLDRVALVDLASQIRVMGFNSVRLPWSNEMFELNPKIDPARLSKNPGLVGLTALEVLDRVIEALAWQGLVVVLDNHMSDADWCCATTDGNGLWFNAKYPETKWLQHWHDLAVRYQNQPAVIGADLRNEPRASGAKSPNWAGTDATLDWRAAAGRGAQAVHASRPDWLVFVAGLGGGEDLRGVFANELKLGIAHRLVYAPHDYSWFHSGATDAASVKKNLGDNWGYILAQGKTYTAPIWVGEFGVAQTDAKSTPTTSESIWFQSFRQYLTDADIDWCYWALNGTAARGTDRNSSFERTVDTVETFGILAPDWAGPAPGELLSLLKVLQPATQFP